MRQKPLGHKSYGHIPHLPGSRMGPGDHKCSAGQARIATGKTRDKHDRVIVQEKLDGSNVSVALIDGDIVPLGRAGWPANTSPYKTHHLFHEWAMRNEVRFRDVLNEGERLCGEWLAEAVGTRYDLPHEPFVAFDIMQNRHERAPYFEFSNRVLNIFQLPFCLSFFGPMRIPEAMHRIGRFGFHGALEPVEGAVWRVERNRMIDRRRGAAGGRKWVVDFVVKYVRPDKIDGKYLDKGVMNTWKECVI